MKKIAGKLCAVLCILVVTISVAGASSFSCFAAVAGDVNGDGSRNANDLTLLRKILLGVEPEVSGAYVNEDDSIDVRDLVRLKKLIANPPEEYWSDGNEQGGSDIFPVE